MMSIVSSCHYLMSYKNIFRKPLPKQRYWSISPIIFSAIFKVSSLTLESLINFQLIFAPLIDKGILFQLSTHWSQVFSARLTVQVIRTTLNSELHTEDKISQSFRSCILSTSSSMMFSGPWQGHRYW